MQDKLTQRFLSALQAAQSLALHRDQNYLEPIHLFSALLNQEGSAYPSLLQQAGVNVPELRARVLRRLSVMRSTASVTTAGGTMTVRSSVIRYTRG